eukprot:6444391-Pyramimonas_sp.AAC.1
MIRAYRTTPQYTYASQPALVKIASRSRSRSLSSNTLSSSSSTTCWPAMPTWTATCPLRASRRPSA